MVFAELGLPTADVYLLTGGQWRAAKEAGYADLRADLRRMCAHPVIVRCDIAEGTIGEDILLPTSPPSTDPSLLVSFMEEAASKFEHSDMPLGDWAFLVAREVPARASAMVYAQPQGQIVQVDGLWGYPDGLLHYPHDTYFYDHTDGSITEKLRCKERCLLTSEDAWATMPVNPPLDWGRVLSKSEVETLARWALAIADRIGHQVQLMALARIGGRRGPDSCLPWHYTEWEIPPYRVAREYVPSREPLKIIHSPRDLAELKDQEASATIRGLLLQPETNLLRNTEFLVQVAKAAAETSLPVYFEGSLLGHAYYVMAGVGATLIPLAEALPSSQAKQYNKLVRDLVPAIIRKAGGTSRVRTLPREEALTLLAQKLIEEAFELWDCGPESLAGELADVVEVVESLREHAGIPSADLDSIRERKKAERGGFQALVFLEETRARPLRLTDPDPGTLPLLFDQEPLTNDGALFRSRKLDRSPISLHAGEWPHAPIRVTIPLVPPVTHGQKARLVVAKHAGYQVEAAYDGGRLTLTIRHLKPFAPAEQLTLPNFT
jgi:predicted house-cleaning noncanonical NTP pyrophosphatase (MazG superfamily)